MSLVGDAMNIPNLQDLIDTDAAQQQAQQTQQQQPQSGMVKPSQQQNSAQSMSQYTKGAMRI
jgi:hypothetical protein